MVESGTQGVGGDEESVLETQGFQERSLVTEVKRDGRDFQGGGNSQGQ